MRGAGTLGKRIGYGWLYNWYAVFHASGLAPDGWRVPLFDDYWWFVDQGNSIPAVRSDTNEWLPLYETGSHLIGEDQYGLTLIPGGIRNEVGEYSLIRYQCSLWILNYGGYLRSTTHNFNFPIMLQNYGCSLRCIQDKASGETDGDTGTLTDVEGNIYKWVVIGDYRWMAENLRTTKYRNGNTIPEITDNTAWANDTTGARCAYNNDHYFVYPPNQ